MRFTWLFLILVAVSAYPKFKENAQVNREMPHSTALFNLRKRISEMRSKEKETKQKSPTPTLFFEERLQGETAFQKLHAIKQDKIDPSDSISEVNERAHVDENLFQGDTVLTDDQAEELVEHIQKNSRAENRSKRQAYKGKRYPKLLWSRGVNYFFNETLSERAKQVFLKAVNLWQKDTCINFYYNPYERRKGSEEDEDEYYSVLTYSSPLIFLNQHTPHKERFPTQAVDRLHVVSGKGCWSNIGRHGGEQKLALAVGGCEQVHTAAHELGHTLGFIHTMARHDRDRYLTVLLGNVKPNLRGEFAIKSPESNDNYGLPLDMGSIMNYGVTSASYNKRPTMVPHDAKYQETLGSAFISFIDLLMMNEFYGCKEKCNPHTSARCSMGGFPHPRDCSRCICPRGYGGRYCNERPNGCGERLQAALEYKTLIDELGDGGEAKDEFTECIYWIESPPGTRIEVVLDSFTDSIASDGCTYAGVEIKTNEDQRLTGYRFCGRGSAGTALVSYSNLVPVITYNREFTTRTVLRYRYGRVPESDVITSRGAHDNNSEIKCEDREECPEHVRRGFCETYPPSVTQNFCPIACGTCQLN